MIQFNLDQLLLDQRLSISDLAKKLRIPYKSIDVMSARGTIKPAFLKTLETHFGDCSSYIKKTRKAA